VRVRSKSCQVGSAGARLPTAATAVGGATLNYITGCPGGRYRGGETVVAALSPSPMTSCPKFAVALDTTTIQSIRSPKDATHGQQDGNFVAHHPTAAEAG